MREFQFEKLEKITIFFQKSSLRMTIDTFFAVRMSDLKTLRFEILDI